MFTKTCYRPQTKLWEGNVFTPVCQSFCSQRGDLPDKDPPLDRDPTPFYGKEQAVRILLECIHVWTIFTDPNPPDFSAYLLWTLNIVSIFHCYRPQWSWGKVMFLQASVIQLTGEVPHTPPQSRHPPPRADTLREQTPPRADTPPSRHTPQSRHPLEQTPPSPEQTPSPRRACCEIRSTRGRYASYWNAILLSKNIIW